MNNQQVKDLQQSYLEYAHQLPTGLIALVLLLKEKELQVAFISIANLAEGLQSLLIIEQFLSEQNITINSTISSSMDILHDINVTLNTGNIDQLINIIEYPLLSLFESVSKWGFKNH